MQNRFPKSELNALIHLLDDPDEEVYRHVTDKLISLGTRVIPSLEDAWSKTFDPQLHGRLEQLIHHIQFDKLLKDAGKWAKGKADDLLQGAMLISRFQYPDQDEFAIKEVMDRMAREIWQEAGYQLKPLEQVNVFNHVLFSLNGFAGNTQNIHDPRNHFIKHVLESKKGNPISLGILYLILAEKVRMPVYGVVLPQHFVLSFHKDYLLPDDSIQHLSSSILFYINPFNKGIIFSRDDITTFLKKLNVEPTTQHYIPSGNREIIVALINSLLVSYELAGVTERLHELTKLKDVISEYI